MVVKTGVESGAVVEGFDVIEDGGAGLGAGSEAMMIYQFVFEGEVVEKEGVKSQHLTFLIDGSFPQR